MGFYDTRSRPFKDFFIALYTLSNTQILDYMLRQPEADETVPPPNYTEEDRSLHSPWLLWKGGHPLGSKELPV